MDDALKHSRAVVFLGHCFDHIMHELDDDLLLLAKELFVLFEQLDLPAFASVEKSECDTPRN